MGVYLANLAQELSSVEDTFSVEAQILQDTLKSERNSISKLLDQRVKKIVRRALRSARSASREEVLPGMTEEEEEIYRQMLSAIATGRENILARVSQTEKPPGGRRDICRDYQVVRLLDSVPEFVGVDGRNYLLGKDDVAVIPAVHARNLRNRNLATEVNMRD